MIRVDAYICLRLAMKMNESRDKIISSKSSNNELSKAYKDDEIPKYSELHDSDKKLCDSFNKMEHLG